MAKQGTKSNDNDTQTKSRKNGSNGSSSSFSDQTSAFFGGQTGALVGAAVAGVALGLAANMGRKALVQSPSMMSGNWDDALKTEHAATLALFDQLEATTDKQKKMRAGLVMKIKYALAKHALQEENAIYPAMREANEAHDADELNGEHGYVKTYLYELENMKKDTPEFLARVRDFRQLLEQHIRNEEENIFPRLRAAMTDEQNRKLTLAMHKEGVKLA